MHLKTLLKYQEAMDYFGILSGDFGYLFMPNLAISFIQQI